MKYLVTVKRTTYLTVEIDCPSDIDEDEIHDECVKLADKDIGYFSEEDEEWEVLDYEELE